MNPQERQLVDELFERLTRLEGAPRDAEADAAIAQGLSRAPHAVYPLVQTVLVQEEALKRAAARIEELEGRPATDAREGGFLDSMRSAVFGRQGQGGSVPSVPASRDDRPAWNTGAVLQNAPQADPRAQQGGGFGGSFLGTAAAAAAGVIGGSMLMNSIGGLFGGGNRQGFGEASATDKGSEGANPWGDQSKGDLAREAGADDIGRGGGRDEDTRQGMFDQASSEDHDYDEDYEADDFDSGDSDYA